MPAFISKSCLDWTNSDKSAGATVEAGRGPRFVAFVEGRVGDQGRERGGGMDFDSGSYPDPSDREIGGRWVGLFLFGLDSSH